ncbi:hypothetical protein LTS10_003211 [Elasticomyces elasticus]|nr:hypothetical protein LTS10_003211 [Elasticomyces elasticus]
MDVITFLRLSYLSAAALVLVVALIPPFRARFLAYGARTSTPNTPAAEHEKDLARRANGGVGFMESWLDKLAAIQVPHSWFTSFYIASLAWSLVWATQVFTAGPLFRFVAYLAGPREETMTYRQIVVTWAMLLVQGSRRLYESREFAGPSKSQMWFVHWVLGLGFYTATGMAIWVEGIPAIQSHKFTLDSIAITGPDVRTFFAILLFILASGIQHDCHAYLFSLKSKSTPPSSSKPIQSATLDKGQGEGEYKFPEHPAFSYVIAPHYTAECLIYLALTIMAAPQGQWMNGTLGCATIFVVVNLGATADVTREWYRQKFGRVRVGRKWRMLPFVW